jgi:hypothetical protein
LSNAHRGTVILELLCERAQAAAPNRIR